jgi:hypothetical protein
MDTARLYKRLCREETVRSSFVLRHSQFLRKSETVEERLEEETVVVQPEWSES